MLASKPSGFCNTNAVTTGFSDCHKLILSSQGFILKVAIWKYNL